MMQANKIIDNQGIYRKVKLINSYDSGIDAEYDCCPRCTGTLVLSSDYYGDYWGCLCCGHHIDLDTPIELSRLNTLAKLYKQVHREAVAAN